MAEFDPTDPGSLSPAAQAVLDGTGATGTAQELVARGIASAALRAAADRIEADSIWHGYQEHTGVRWSAHQMRHYATELEGRHG